MVKNKIYILLFVASIYSQDQIGEGLYSQDLVSFIQQNYTTNNVLSYNSARDILFSTIDIDNNNRVYCIYTNYFVTLPTNVDPSTYLYENGMNCEHLWPQSMYEIIIANNMKSDMHHLRPCKENVNSYRSNKPFNESLDNSTNNWLWLSYNYSNTPSNNINEYSENGSSVFEPREDVKGDIARALFYFYTIYENEADNDFFEQQKDILFDWHEQDPVQESEITRTWLIAQHQDNIPNPFILDDSLIERAYFYNPLLPGDVNTDSIVNVVDIVFIVSIIIDDVETTPTQFTNADLDGNLEINVSDIVALVNIILS